MENTYKNKKDSLQFLDKYNYLHAYIMFIYCQDEIPCIHGVYFAMRYIL